MTSYSLQITQTINRPDSDQPEQLLPSIWAQLVNIRDWGQWLPHTVGVQAPDSDDVGRGSQLRINTRGGIEVWQINYLDTGTRLVIQTVSANPRRACAIETRLTANGQIELVLNTELEINGLKRLLAPVLHWQFRRWSRQCARGLQHRLQA